MLLREKLLIQEGLRLQHANSVLIFEKPIRMKALLIRSLGSLGSMGSMGSGSSSEQMEELIEEMARKEFQASEICKRMQ